MRTWILNVRNSLFYSLSLLWIWIMGIQWISFMDYTWYEETTSIVLISMTVVILVEMLLPVKRAYRLVLEGAVILYVIHRELVKYWVYMPSGTLANRIQQYIEHLSPYIWIAGGAWFLLLLSSLLVTTKRRIIVFSGLHVIAFSILDSFTASTLWPEVAWTMFAAMCWLVSEHFRRFQARFPSGWRHLRKVPLKIFVHAAVLFSVMFIAGVSMPTVPPTLTDPYTAWVGGSTVESANGLDVSGEVTSAEGVSTSGYSRNDNNLGGGFNFDYTPVMSVKSGKRNYWRGETRQVYSGTGWSEARGGSKYDNVSVGSSLDRGDAPTGETEKLEQTITMLNDQVYPVLFGAFRVSEIKELDNADAGRIYWESDQSALHWDTDAKKPQYPKTYTVISEVPVVPEDEIRTKTFKDLYGGGKLDDAYLQIPKGFPVRTRKLAEQVASSAETPYEKVGLLQNYLVNNFKYTNQPDLSKKTSGDFVDSFLFDIKEGYCDYFSSSMVMMARSLGIPARWVKGYAPGQQQFDTDGVLQRNGQNPADSDSYTITNADAHSWAEVYFGDYGWVPVEATPGFNMPLLTHQEDSKPVTAPVVEEEEKPKVEQEKAAVGTGSASTGLPAWAIVWITALILILLAGYILWLMRIRVRFLLVGIRKGSKLSADQKVIIMTERWVGRLKRKGIRRSSNETLRESVIRWEKEMPALSNSLGQLLTLFEKARYSPSSVSEAEWRSVYNHSRELKAALKKAEDSAA
ncbi:transglutaminase TgpA family protein [Paenibacillus sp. SAF-054]|uniref:transglutaminase TgpA family protein n=2 Tax=unclassified Paenibacillus TaxID=185978 RepID=UPI003F7E1598